MELNKHGVRELFQQLGMESSSRSIDRFIQKNQLRMNDGELYRAIFWNPSQAKFIKDAVEEDGEWAEAVDELDVRLRRQH